VLIATHSGAGSGVFAAGVVLVGAGFLESWLRERPDTD